ncbi:hypothetical protein [Haloactinopolyspora sp.]|nr:hypothetical protein [Haloactinopolyspora sp.]
MSRRRKKDQDEQAWECEKHRIRAGQRCALCADQLELPLWGAK